MHLVLASSSRWRQSLLAAAGIPVALVPPGVDEAAITAPDPVALAVARARAKAWAAEVPGAVVIGADQVAHWRGEAFGKPLDPADHRRRLRQLRGDVHTLTTGVVVRFPGEEVAFVEHTRLWFRADLGDDELDAYVASGEGSDCAGGYRAEALGGQLIERVEGDWSNVIGLPLYPLVSALRARGWRPSFAPLSGG